MSNPNDERPQYEINEDNALDIEQTVDAETNENRVVSRDFIPTVLVHCQVGKGCTNTLQCYSLEFHIKESHPGEAEELNQKISDLQADGVPMLLTCSGTPVTHVEVFEGEMSDTEAVEIVRAAFQNLSNTVHFSPEIHTIVEHLPDFDRSAKPTTNVVDKEYVVLNIKNEADVPSVKAALMLLDAHGKQLRHVTFVAEAAKA